MNPQSKDKESNFEPLCQWGTSYINDELTDAGVAVVAEVVALPAVALEHVVVDVEAHLVANIIKLFLWQTL